MGIALTQILVTANRGVVGDLAEVVKMQTYMELKSSSLTIPSVEVVAVHVRKVSVWKQRML